MMSFRRHGAAALLAILCTSACGTDPGPARIRDFEWLVGTWVGPGQNQFTIEQTWTAPIAGSMTGTHLARIGQDVRVRADLRLVGGENGVVLLGSPEGSPLTNYRLAGSGGQWAVFSNPRAEGTQVCRFQRQGDELVVKFQSVDSLGAERSTDLRLQLQATSAR